MIHNPTMHADLEIPLNHPYTIPHTTPTQMRSAWIATCLLLGWLAVAATAASVDPAIVNGHDAAGPGR